MKMKKLEKEHPDINDIPEVTVRRLFDFSSMEHAPKNYYQDPVMSEIYAESMIEALAMEVESETKVQSFTSNMKIYGRPMKRTKNLMTRPKAGETYDQVIKWVK